MTTAARPRDRLIAAVVLSSVIGLVGGGLAAWGIYARFGPVERVIVQTVVGSGNGSSGDTLTAGAIAQAKSVSVVEVLTQPVTVGSLVTGPTGIVNGFVVSANGLVSRVSTPSKARRRSASQRPGATAFRRRS